MVVGVPLDDHSDDLRVARDDLVDVVEQREGLLEDDGLTDEEELAAGTDPFDADSDDDGVPDGDEPDWNLDTDGDGLINALDPDSDDDGILDGTELGVTTPHDDTDVSANHFVPDEDPTTTTDPLSADTDSDGVPDHAEDLDGNGRVDEGETDPLVPGDEPPLDSDGDGLPDVVEELYGTDPFDADSDDDGVLDGNETNWSLDTDGDGLINALDPDSDDDGLFDGTELGVTTPHDDTDVGAGHFVPDADPSTTTSPLLDDTDGGGLGDRFEDWNANGRVDEKETSPTDPDDDDPLRDSDGDGIPDVVEGWQDTDGDGVPDFLDLDSDGDGIPDAEQAGPNPLEPIDTDGDGIPDFQDLDADGDGFLDTVSASGGLLTESCESSTAWPSALSLVALLALRRRRAMRR